MTVGTKIRTALTGNKEARALLMRDNNKVVQLAVIKNPRITEGEIQWVAGQRHYDSEIFRHIARNREWMKNYQVRLTLIKNPKTPIPVATPLVKTLKERDIRHLAKDKNVPAAVAACARGWIMKRS